MTAAASQPSDWRSSARRRAGRLGIGRPPAAFGAVALVLVVAIAVAYAARGTPVWTLVGAGGADRVAVLLGVAALWGVGLLVAAGLTLAVHRAIIARRPAAPPLRATLLRAVPGATLVLVVSSLVLIAGMDLAGGAESEARGLRSTEAADRPGRVLDIVGWWAFTVIAGEGAPDPEGPLVPGQEPGGVLPVLLVGGALAVLLGTGAAAWWYYGRSAGSGHTADEDQDVLEPDRAALHGAVVGTIDGMLADPDPHTAIIGAYARLLEDLASCGAGRREPEAPVEHLRRVLAIRDVRPGPLRRLIELFELARFSTHPLDRSHRDDALAALRAVATDLAVPDGAPAETPVARSVGAEA